MIELCLQCITLCIKHGIYFLMEHPEDLGATSRFVPHARPAAFGSFFPFGNGFATPRRSLELCFNAGLGLARKSPLASYTTSSLCKSASGQVCLS